MTTSEDENLLEHCAMTMHVTCVAMSLDKLEPEKATWQLLHNMAAVFANTKTHSGPKQIIVYHGHETTHFRRTCTLHRAIVQTSGWN